MRNHTDPQVPSSAYGRAPAAAPRPVPVQQTLEVQEILSLDPDIDLDMFVPETAAPEIRSVRVSIPDRMAPLPPPASPVAVDDATGQTAGSTHEPVLLGTWTEPESRRSSRAVLVVSAVLALLLLAALVLVMPDHRTPSSASLPEASTPVVPAPAAQVSGDEGTTLVPPLTDDDPPPDAGATTVEPEASQSSAPFVPAAGLVAAGWLKVDAPIDVDVAIDGVVIGSSRSARTMLEAGSHQLTFRNASLGYQRTERVTIETGQIHTIRLIIPGGTVSVNARPWANVSIDGTAIGETPLGNVAVSAGEHAVVFSHPQLGERRVDTVVRTGEHVRLNADLTAR